MQSHEDSQKSLQDDIHNLGEEFCQWFFELLNSQHPLGVKSEEAWGPQHFWDDAKMKFSYNTLEKNMEEYVGAEMVSLRLLSLVKEEYLLFNPNLHANGLKCAMSPHGLVLVAVAGTVHRGNSCLGIFEQIFGLISCPLRENTWKIKVMSLKIVGQNALEPGMQIEKPSIKYESNQLQELYDGKELIVFEPQKFWASLPQLSDWARKEWLQPCDAVSFESKLLDDKQRYSLKYGYRWCFWAPFHELTSTAECYFKFCTVVRNRVWLFLMTKHSYI